MSQLNSHKVPLRGEKQATAARGRAITKASGDATTRVKPAKQRSKSRSNKIPKNMRFDLENALVGLCDVWFEEIKPHLVRNNIKLHISDAAPVAGGDHNEMPAGASGCSHLDPGAASDPHRRASVSSAGCFSTQPTASRTQWRRRPVRYRSPRHQNQQRSEYRDVERCWCRRRVSVRAPAAADWRTPRVCRTYSVLAVDSCPKRSQTHKPTDKRPSRQRLKDKNKFWVEKSTQTDISQLCMQHQGYGVKSTKLRPLVERSPPLVPKLALNRRNLSKEILDSPYRPELPKMSPSFGFFNYRKISPIKNDQQQVKEEKDVVDKPLERSQNGNGEKCDTGKVLRLLYQNPREKGPNSTMNLIMPVDRHRKVTKQPWR